MALKPIDVWGHWGAPNPWKICMVLEELELPYQIHVVEFNEVKQPSYLEINPNGRLPAIKDPNTGVTLWESAAIILYLVDGYDKERKISFDDSPNKYLSQQWLMFQVSGQGPYFGQATWFVRFHPEKLPSAIDRYLNETERIIGVLDKGLQRSGWLVGNKCTYADIAFVTWAKVAEGLLKEVEKADVLTKFPAYTKWLQTLESRGAVGKIVVELVELNL